MFLWMKKKIGFSKGEKWLLRQLARPSVYITMHNVDAIGVHQRALRPTEKNQLVCELDFKVWTAPRHCY